MNKPLRSSNLFRIIEREQFWRNSCFGTTSNQNSTALNGDLNHYESKFRRKRTADREMNVDEHDFETVFVSPNRDMSFDEPKSNLNINGIRMEAEASQELPSELLN